MNKWFGGSLIPVILFIEIPRFTGAYDQIDPLLLKIPLRALASGVAIPAGMAYIFHTWWTTTRSRRDYLLIPFLVRKPPGSQ
ncbi:MAG: hypothetical protein PVI09_21645 [Anaerolineae bacterium]|jgi:hypothetical protein